MTRRLSHRRDLADNRRPSWQEYQRQLQQPRDRWRRRRFGLLALLLVAAVGLAVYPIRGERPAPATPAPAPPPPLGKTDIQPLLPHPDLFNRRSPEIHLDRGSQRLTLETTLDMGLQQALMASLDPDTARYIGIVAVAPATGRVLAMAGYDRTGESANPCLDNRFPAASVFKIVTAAAAIETCDLDGDSQMTFNGRQYTLYRRQLKEQETRYTRHIRFEDAFAKSINPVFGKLGALRLGGDTLARYAEGFGFNRRLPFEAALPISRIEVSEADSYQWAEVASGFNRKTTLTPLHGALLAAAAINGGRLYEPTVVGRIVDDQGRVRYRGRPRLAGHPMTPETAAAIADMMAASVRRGTCRKPFRGMSRHRVLGRLTIGGKSGSIDNPDHTARIDWFVGYADERDGPARLALAAVVAHEKYIGTRAGEYARQAFTDYFDQLFARRRAQAETLGRADDGGDDGDNG